MKTTKTKDGKIQVYWKINQSTWESIVRVSMQNHITPEQLLIEAVKRVT